MSLSRRRCQYKNEPDQTLHGSAGSAGPLGVDVRLTVQPVTGGNVIVMPHLPMTEENRRAVYLQRKMTGES